MHVYLYPFGNYFYCVDFEDFECQKAIITLLLSSQICLNTRHQCQKTLLTLLTEKLVNQSKKGHVTDGNINVDLSLYNLLICSGIELNSGGNLRYTVRHYNCVIYSLSLPFLKEMIFVV